MIGLPSAVTPQEIDGWLKEHCKTAATANRYKAFLSLCYREGIANGKLSVNPVRSVRHRKEPKGRQRFLSRAEYDRLHEIIADRFPEHLAEFVVSVHTGMRAGEQYGVKWRQVHLDRKTIELSETKNTDPRTVHLNQVALDAIKSVMPDGAKPSDVVFPRTAEAIDNRAWFFPCLDEAEIEDYTWHNNRHTFWSLAWRWLVRRSKRFRRLAGRKSIQMAARYAHLSPAHTASVVDKLV